MKIEIRRVTDWQRVVDAARFTQGKEPLGHEPSDEFKKQMILSEHSPLRELEFDIKMYGIPYWVSNHFVRHVHAWKECGAYIHIISETIVAVCDGNFFPCVFKDSEDILATDWEEV